jgi:hypothetical protein
MIPDRPKPSKVNFAALKVWGFKNSNDATIISVLKKLDLLSSSGEPTSHYINFMQREGGAAALGNCIKTVYSALFESVKNPAKATNEDLRSFFNIYSGGGDKTIRLQIETFKALADHASFDGVIISSPVQGAQSADMAGGQEYSTPGVHIDLHIHLPENKTKSDYDAIFESIANHIYRKNL